MRTKEGLVLLGLFALGGCALTGGPAEIPTQQYVATIPRRGQLAFLSTTTGFKAAQDAIRRIVDSSGVPVSVQFTIDDKSAGETKVSTFNVGLDRFAAVALQNTRAQSLVATYGTSSEGVQIACGPVVKLASPPNGFSAPCVAKIGLMSKLRYGLGL
jgi:hypothetical protein